MTLAQGIATAERDRGAPAHGPLPGGLRAGEQPPGPLRLGAAHHAPRRDAAPADPRSRLAGAAVFAGSATSCRPAAAWVRRGWHSVGCSARPTISRNRHRVAFAYGRPRHAGAPARRSADRCGELRESGGDQRLAGADGGRDDRPGEPGRGDGSLRRSAGRARGVSRHASRSRRRTSTTRTRSFARQRLAGLAIRQGDYRGSGAAAGRRRCLGEGARARGSRKTLAYDRGRLALARGDLRQAERILAGYLAEVDPEDRLLRYTVRVRIAEALARRGNLDRAEREITAASAGTGELARRPWARTT